MSPVLDPTFSVPRSASSQRTGGEAGTVSSSALPPAASRWDIAIEVLLVALLAFLPAALGGVYAWGEAVGFVAVAAMALCLVLRTILRRDIPFATSWAYLPIVLFLGLAAFQLLPLPAAWLGWISPATAQMKNTLLSDTANAHAHQTISFYAWATHHDLGIILAAAVIFILTLNVFRRPEQIRRLLLAMTLIGAAIALVALAQDVTESSSIYWSIPLAAPAAKPALGLAIANSGPFANHNHFAQFMNLSLGATLALLLVLVREQDQPSRASSWRAARARRRWIPVLCGVALAELLSIALSLSRGGIIASASAILATVALVGFTQRRGMATIIAALGLAAFVAITCVDLDSVWSRFTVDQGETRPEMVRDALKLVRRFPLLGTGLGTHQYVFATVDSRISNTVATHLENEYVQAMEETGILGFAMVLGFVLTVAASYVVAARQINKPLFAAANGLAFGLIAVMVHSFSDFGQHLPANAILSAVFCALLVGLSRLASPTTAQGAVQSAQFPARSRPRMALGMVTAMIVALAAMLPIPGAVRSARAEAQVELSQQAQDALDRPGAKEDAAAYTRLIRPAQAAANLCPDNAGYRFQLATDRWKAISHLESPEAPNFNNFASHIVDELKESRSLCPTVGQVWSLEGQIEAFVLNRPEGADHIREGYRLAPSDASVCLAEGSLEVSLGKVNQAMAPLQHALQLDPGLLTSATDLLIQRADRPDLALDLAADSPGTLLSLANQFEHPAQLGLSPRPDLALAATRQAIATLQRTCQSPQASGDSLAMLAGLQESQNHLPAAIECYRRALSLQYERTDWRLALAHLLFRLGKNDEAGRQAQMCLQIQPNSSEAAKLLGSIQAAADKPDNASSQTKP